METLESSRGGVVRPVAMNPRLRLSCPELPDHAVEEIFARLPAKQVLRLRCLSRAWAATLSSDGFLDRHLHAANLHGGPGILCLHDLEDDGEDRPKVHASSLDRPGDAPFIDAPLVVTRDRFPHLITTFMDYNDPPYQQVPHLVAHQCRGLALLYAVNRGVCYVCNPSTGQMATLPEGRTTGCRSLGELADKYDGLGLGYDTITRKHKVVRVYYRGRGGGDGQLPVSAGCEVYEINIHNSTWSWRPTHEKPMGWIDRFKASVFVQGHFYWSAHRKFDPKQEIFFIMSFSIDRETFGSVPPPLLTQRDLRRHDLTEIGGQLCLFCSYFHGERRYDVWLLSQYGWDLHCRLDLATTSPELNKFMGTENLRPFLITPLATIDNGRRILLTQHDAPQQIFAYTPETGHSENLVDCSSSALVSQVAVYEQSIASPGRQPREDIVLISSPSTQAMWLVLRKLPERNHGNLMCVCRSWRRMIESYHWDKYSSWM